MKAKDLSVLWSSRAFPRAAASFAAGRHLPPKCSSSGGEGKYRPRVCSPTVCHLFSHRFLPSAAAVRCTAKRGAFTRVIPINVSADLGERVCSCSARARRGVPVFSFQRRSMVCWDLPPVTEQDFSPHSDSVYFWIWSAMVTFGQL